jgi:drug/metabolite transporter (DMT)-like permease
MIPRAYILSTSTYISSLVSAVSEPQFLLSIGYLAVLSSVGAFLLYNFSTSVITATRSASFSNIITVVTVLAGVIILKEQFSIWEYILCAVIILGVWGVNYFTSDNKQI